MSLAAAASPPGAERTAAGPAPAVLPLLVLWEDFLGWLLPALEKLPKSVRFTFTTRLQGTALDILESLVEARFRRDRQPALREASLRLERLRALIRVAHGQKLLPNGAYRFASERLDEAGRMLGGWLKHASSPSPPGRGSG